MSGHVPPTPSVELFETAAKQPGGLLEYTDWTIQLPAKVDSDVLYLSNISKFYTESGGVQKFETSLVAFGVIQYHMMCTGVRIGLSGDDALVKHLSENFKLQAILSQRWRCFDEKVSNLTGGIHKLVQPIFIERGIPLALKLDGPEEAFDEFSRMCASSTGHLHFRVELLGLELWGKDMEKFVRNSTHPWIHFTPHFDRDPIDQQRFVLRSDGFYPGLFQPRETFTDEQLGQKAFEAYGVSTGGKTYDGKPIPTWDEITPKIREAWTASARVVRSAVE